MNTVLEPGTLVGQRFVVQAAAGHGGMGTVYRGRDVLRDETVAIKLLDGNFRDVILYTHRARVRGIRESGLAHRRA